MTSIGTAAGSERHSGDGSEIEVKLLSAPPLVPSAVGVQPLPLCRSGAVGCRCKQPARAAASCTRVVQPAG